MDASLSLTISSLADHPEMAPTLLEWHWNAWGEGEPDSARSAWLDTIRSRAGESIPFTLIAFVDEEPVGCISVCWDDIDDRFPEDGPWVSGMVVRSDARNLGIGRALLADAERRCAEQGHSVLWLHTSEAKSFYERCGWQVEADKTGLGQDAVLSRRLVDADTA